MPNLRALHKLEGVVTTKRYPTIQREIKSVETERNRNNICENLV